MDKNNGRDLITEDIPIELLQIGIKIADKEVKENGFLTLEVDF